MPADVSSVKQESDVLKDCKIHFINYGSNSKQDMEALVRKLGGTVSTASVTYPTHCSFIVGDAQMPGRGLCHPLTDSGHHPVSCRLEGCQSVWTHSTLTVNVKCQTTNHPTVDWL